MRHHITEVIAFRIQRIILYGFPDVFSHHEIRIEPFRLQIRGQCHKPKEFLIVGQHVHMEGLDGFFCVRTGRAQQCSRYNAVYNESVVLVFDTFIDFRNFR